MSGTTEDIPTPANRHALTPYEAQRAQLAKLLKDPAKPVNIPAAPTEKELRPAREMMKNVQGSSAGAGSGEFHVYKQNRRREYERVKIMEEKHEKETAAEEYARRKAQFEAESEAKTSKNRAKRQKRKERARGGKAADGGGGRAANGDAKEFDGQAPGAKRRKVGGDGTKIVFRLPGEESDDSEEMEDGDPGPRPAPDAPNDVQPAAPIAEEHEVKIIDE